MVGIGINTNVSVSNEIKVNEKGTLELFLKQGGMTEAEKIISSLAGNDVDDKSTKILVFGPNSVKDFNGNIKTAAQVLKEIQTFRTKLHDILTVFIPTTVLATEFGARLPLEVTGVAPELFEKQLSSDVTIASISTKIAEKFVALCVEHKVYTSKTTCRVKLLRQKLEKPYATIPNFGDWIEPMDAPGIKVTANKYDLTDYDAIKYPGINKLSSQPIPADNIPVAETNVANGMFEEPEAPVVNDLFND